MPREPRFRGAGGGLILKNYRSGMFLRSTFEKFESLLIGNFFLIALNRQGCSRSGTMNIQDAQSLGQAIRQQRRRLKVTQRDLAMTSGTGLRFIIDLEKGKPTCQLGKALEIVRALGLKLEISEP